MKKNFIILITAAAVCVTMTVSCGKKKTQHAAEAQTVSVAVPVVDSVVLYRSYPGVLAAEREAPAVARVDGTLESLHFHGGDFVHQGQVLFTIESDTYRDAVERAQAAVASAESQLDYATQHYQALCRALESDAVSRMEVAQGESAMETARASLNSARAELNTATTTLGYCTVRAPFDGHISSNAYSVGAYISGSGSPVTLATVYDDEWMLAKFSIEDQTFMDVVRNNVPAHTGQYFSMPISFSDTLPHQYTAQLSYMAPSINASSGTMNVEARVHNRFNELRSGQFININLPIGYLSRAILIKDSAISSDQRGKYVYVVNDSNQVVYTPVVTGQLVRDSLRVIERGLNADDKYVTKALLRVRPGMRVNPQLETVPVNHSVSQSEDQTNVQ